MTFLELIDSVAQSAFYTTSAGSGFDSAIRRAVNEAISSLSSEELFFNEASHSWAVNGNTTNPLTLPPYYQTVSSLTLFRPDGSPASSLPLSQLPHESLLLLVSNSHRQPPSFYSIFSSSLYIAPLPDTQYTLTLSYYRAWPPLSTNQDTNPWLEQGASVVRASALSTINAEIHHNFDRAAYFSSVAARELSKLRALSSARNAPEGTILRCF